MRKKFSMVESKVNKLASKVMALLKNDAITKVSCEFLKMF